MDRTVSSLCPKIGKDLALETGMRNAQPAIAIIVIPGTTSLRHLKENWAAWDLA